MKIIRRSPRPTPGGHRFPFDGTPCVLCGMTRVHYDDNGHPRCRGAQAGGLKTGIPVPD